MKTGTELIAAERTRQVSEEGWTAEHDDSHTDGELAAAAAVYANDANYNLMLPRMDAKGCEHVLLGRAATWPFEQHWLKLTQHDRIRELVKAGALCAAEIDRLQRLRDYDPTPYCAICKAMTAAACDCPPPHPD